MSSLEELRQENQRVDVITDKTWGIRVVVFSIYFFCEWGSEYYFCQNKARWEHCACFKSSHRFIERAGWFCSSIFCETVCRCHCPLYSINVLLMFFFFFIFEALSYQWKREIEYLGRICWKYFLFCFYSCVFLVSFYSPPLVYHRHRKKCCGDVQQSTVIWNRYFMHTYE